jgi:diguanylate cyclase (GGDEF)-like protein
VARPARKIGGSVVAWRPIMPFVALFVMLILFAVGGMLVIAHEADVSDAYRAREAVTRTFTAAVGQLGAAVEMNAAPPVAGTLSNPLATPALAYDYFNFTSSRAVGYYGVVVLNADGSAFAGTRFGQPWTGPTLEAAARMIAPVAARLPAQSGASISALRRDEHGEPEAIAITNIVDAAPGTTVPQGRRLAMIAPVAAQIVPKILPSLGVEDFRILPAPEATDVTGSSTANAVTLPVDNGAPTTFAWRPRTPGRTAIERWAPAIGGLLLAALAMLTVAARANVSATRALKQLAHHDSLTGLANRAAFTDELDHRRARGDGVVLGMIDLNGFKGVNDTFGHLVGDELLQAVAAELARAAGPRDFVARLGGDEFAWLSPCRVTADRFAAAFTERIAQPLAVGLLRLQVEAAIGVASAQPEMTASTLMGIADAQLYECKHALRSRRSVA